MIDWFFNKKSDVKKLKKANLAFEQMVKKKRDENIRITQSTQNTLKKYVNYLENAEEVTNYLFSLNKRNFDTFELIMENAFISNPFSIKEHIKLNKEE